MPVTTWEYQAFTAMRAGAPLKSPHELLRPMEPTRLWPKEALEYMRWLSERVRVEFMAPTQSLWRALAELGGLPPLPSKHLAITEEVAEGARRPLQTNERASPGQDRCNGLGLIDMIGNTREYVRKRGDDLLYTIGGEFDEPLERILRSISDIQLADAAVGNERSGLRLICILE
jgi:formylglycine-generating enzyme required for sulfatase activity